jgi:hypothetical protein
MNGLSMSPSLLKEMVYDTAYPSVIRQNNVLKPPNQDLMPLLGKLSSSLQVTYKSQKFNLVN